LEKKDNSNASPKFSDKKEIRVMERFVQHRSWEDKKLRIALVYPNTYTSGMGGYTVQLLYHLFNNHEAVVCERAFLPIATQSFKVTNTQKTFTCAPITTLESQMQLKNFDIIAFTMHYELDYPNLCWILQNSQIPLYAKDRSENDPIVLVGGPIIRSNPLPISSFIDMAFIGEIEPIWDQFVETWIKIQDEVPNPAEFRTKFYNRVSQLTGFWIPQRDPNTGELLKTQMKVTRSICYNLNDSWHPIEQLIPEFELKVKNTLPFGETVFVEINRGCPHGCRFCMTGHQGKPFRNRSLSQLKEIITALVEKTKIHHITLIGASVTDHPEFISLCQFLVENQIQFAVPSVRVETITKEMATILIQGGMKTITIAPETGSDELRCRLNKCVTNEEILQGCQIIFENGAQNLKLYFIFGFPFESDKDIDAIGSLLQRIAQMGWGKESIRVSINPFIPKAQTPFEAYSTEYIDFGMKSLKNKQNYLQSLVQNSRQITIETLDFEEAFLQTIWAIGDVKTADIIKACSENGFGMARWYGIATKQFRDLIQQQFDQRRTEDFGHRPWNFINPGYSASFLETDWKKAQQNQAGIHCTEECLACGVCKSLKKEI